MKYVCDKKKNTIKNSPLVTGLVLLGEAPAPDVRQGQRTAAVSQMVGETFWTPGWRMNNTTALVTKRVELRSGDSDECEREFIIGGNTETSPCLRIHIKDTQTRRAPLEKK